MSATDKSVYPILGKAPIILAILQIQFRLKKDINNKTFSNLASVREKYPIINETNSAQFQINPQDSKTPISLKHFQNDGYSYTTKDGSKSFTISKTTFTYQMRPPYVSWEDFSSEALSIWRQCGIEENIQVIIRQSIRYVNAFEIKEGKNTIEPSDYFNSYLVVSPKYPDYSRYMFQYTIPLEGYETIAHIGTEIRESLNSIFPFIFDLDVISLKAMDYDNIKLKDTFNKLRLYKNSIFFNSLKERTINLFI